MFWRINPPQHCCLVSIKVKETVLPKCWLPLPGARGCLKGEQNKNRGA